MKNSKVEFIPHATNHFRKQLIGWHQQNEIFKGEEYSSSFTKVAKKFADVSAELTLSGKNLFNFFTILRNDFNSGQINQVQYKILLKPLHALLMEGENDGKEPINVPGFDTKAIVKELKRAGY